MNLGLGMVFFGLKLRFVGFNKSKNLGELE